MVTTAYYLDRPGGTFVREEGRATEPGAGEIRVRTVKTSICQSDVIIYRQGLPRILTWPAILLHEASVIVDAVGVGVESYQVGDLLGVGCDLPCPDADCIYCGVDGTGDWTSCPHTHATGHEFPGFARTHAVLPRWFVERGPIAKFDSDFDPSLACHVEPLACCLEGLTRVNHCIENRVVVLIGAGAQSVYALQCAQAMGARRIVIVNRSRPRLERVLRDFGDDNVVGVDWDDNVVQSVRAACQPFNEPHFVMVNAPAKEGYELATRLVGYGTVVDFHAGVKGAEGKASILHTLDLNNDIHYRLQCFHATHGSSMRGIRLAQQFLSERRLPRIARMTDATERFRPDQLREAIARAADPDSLKVIVDWN